MDILAQVFGFSAIGISLLVYSRKKRERILGFKLVQDILWALHYLLMGAYPAMATNLICASRELAFKNPNKKPLHKWILTGLYFGFYLVSALLTWKDMFSIFPAMSSMFATLAFSLKDPVRLKLLVIPSSLCTLIYNITTAHSASVYVGVSFTIITLCISLTETFLKRRSEKNQE